MIVLALFPRAAPIVLRMLKSCCTLFICALLFLAGALATQPSAERQSKVEISVDLSQTHKVSDKLYGIFFEEVSCIVDLADAEHTVRIDLRTAHAMPRGCLPCNSSHLGAN